jgi:hypothetical protein
MQARKKNICMNLERGKQHISALSYKNRVKPLLNKVLQKFF